MWSSRDTYIKTLSIPERGLGSGSVVRPCIYIDKKCVADTQSAKRVVWVINFLGTQNLLLSGLIFTSSEAQTPAELNYYILYSLATPKFFCLYVLFKSAFSACLGFCFSKPYLVFKFQVRIQILPSSPNQKWSFMKLRMCTILSHFNPVCIVALLAHVLYHSYYSLPPPHHAQFLLMEPYLIRLTHMCIPCNALALKTCMYVFLTCCQAGSKSETMIIISI